MLITVALTLMLLMGVAALVLDAGLAYDQRRSTQAAADHAALAAAWAACDEAPDPVAAGEEAAELNQEGDPTIEVDVASSETDRYEARAEVSSAQKASFGRALGADEIEVVSQATADCTVLERWANDYAVATLGACPVDSSEIGTRVKVVGKTASNLGGSPVSFPTMTEFASLAEGEHVFKFELLDDEALEEHTDGAGRLIDSGIYFAEDGIANLRVDLVDGVEATFVSPERITFQAGSELRAYSGLASIFPGHEAASRLAVFSDYDGDCTDTAVRLEGAAELAGILFAPRGRIVFSMEEDSIATGALIGYGVNVAGSGYALHGNEYVLEFTE